MKRLSLVAAVAVAFAACGETPAPTEMDLPAAFAPGGNGVVASARGSGNLFAPGEGKGRVFAFNAKQQADGTVSGHIFTQLPEGWAQDVCDGNLIPGGGGDTFRGNIQVD